MACNFNCVIKIKGLLKVTGNHIHRTCGNISEAVTTDHYHEVSGLLNSGNSNDLE